MDVVPECPITMKGYSLIEQDRVFLRCKIEYETAPKSAGLGGARVVCTRVPSSDIYIYIYPAANNNNNNNNNNNGKIVQSVRKIVRRDHQ